MNIKERKFIEQLNREERVDKIIDKLIENGDKIIVGAMALFVIIVGIIKIIR